MTMPPQSILRTLGIFTVLVVVFVAAPSASPGETDNPFDLRERYRIVVSDDVYPQATPRETVGSIIDALENSNARYVLAHLVSPSQVDERLHGDARALEKLVVGMTPAKSHHLLDQLDLHLAEGKWTTRGRRASSRVHGVPDLTLEKIGQRWFMHNVSPRPTRTTRSR